VVDHVIAPAPGAPAAGERIDSHYRMCLGCGADHPGGLHLVVHAGDGVSTVGELTISDYHQGAPGLAHGGIIATAMDEMMGSLQILLRVPAVTAHLETDFRQPVPVGSRLIITARVTDIRGRKVMSEAVARLGSDSGPIAVTASAVFVQVGVEHFLTEGASEHVERAREERRNGAPAWWGEVNP
jgi:acyl-coenzyme A thioesterase PaaI-like protein